MLSPHDLVTATLLYIATGAVIWMMLWGSGLVDQTRLHWAALGKPVSGVVIALASFYVIVAWPVFIWRSLKRGVR
jgi:hypothetical protein